MSKKIAVIGTGYVGLIASIGFADFGNTVIGVDVDKEKVCKLNEGISPIYENGIKDYLNRNLKNNRLKFTTDIRTAVRESNVIFIGVGTPSKDDGQADLSQLEKAVYDISQNLNEYKVIVLKSTVPVGTNRWVKKTIEKYSGNKNFDVVSNPEFLREGKAIYDFFHPDRIVIGCESKEAEKIMKDIYRPLYLIETPFVWCNYETAEIIKYANNAYLATKITFINQIANLTEQIDVDIQVVSKALGMDGRINGKFLHAGPGYGGSCFPKDTKALVEIGKIHDVDMSLIKEVIKSNDMQKLSIVKKINRMLNYDIENKKIAILGLAFKSETDDMRESPAIPIISKLIEQSAIINVHDPKAMENAKLFFQDRVKYCDDLYNAIEDSDALILLTEWNEYRNLDLDRISKTMRTKVILDARNILDIDTCNELGFIYEGVGKKRVVWVLA